MAISLRAYFQTYAPNAIVVGDAAYGLNPEDVNDTVQPGGKLSISIPAIPLLIMADVNQMVDPDPETLTISILADNGTTYLFEGQRKNASEPAAETTKK